MKILFIGGTNFIGANAVKILISQGHDVCVFHRGEHNNLESDIVKRIIGERENILKFKSEFASFAPEVIIHMISHSDKHASALMEVADGLVDKVIAISSVNIYRALEVVNASVPSEIMDTPISEDSPLRLTPLQGDNKLAVEEIVMSHATISGTILRLPMVFGPHDYQRRLSPYLRRMDDGRPAILLGKGISKWKSCRGYVENVAHAIALAATDDNSRGQIYHVSDSYALTEIDWIEKIASIVGWKGEIKSLESEQLPSHLHDIINSAQNFDLDTEKIRKHLSYFDKVSLDDALERTIEWERHNPPETAIEQEYKAEDEVLLTMDF